MGVVDETRFRPSKRGGSGWLDSVTPSLSGAWRLLITRRFAVSSDCHHTPDQASGRQEPDAAWPGCRTSDSAPRPDGPH